MQVQFSYFHSQAAINKPSKPWATGTSFRSIPLSIKLQLYNKFEHILIANAYPQKTVIRTA